MKQLKKHNPKICIFEQKIVQKKTITIILRKRREYFSLYLSLAVICLGTKTKIDERKKFKQKTISILQIFLKKTGVIKVHAVILILCHFMRNV